MEYAVCRKQEQSGQVIGMSVELKELTPKAAEFESLTAIVVSMTTGFGELATVYEGGMVRQVYMNVDDLRNLALKQSMRSSRASRNGYVA